MKTQNKNLVFKKDIVVELNDWQLSDINGGSTIIISIPLAIVVALASSDNEEESDDFGGGNSGGAGAGVDW